MSRSIYQKSYQSKSISLTNHWIFLLPRWKPLFFLLRLPFRFFSSNWLGLEFLINSHVSHQSHGRETTQQSLQISCINSWTTSYHHFTKGDKCSRRNQEKKKEETGQSNSTECQKHLTSFQTKPLMSRKIKPRTNWIIPTIFTERNSEKTKYFH